MEIESIVENIAKRELWSVDKIKLKEGGYGIWKNAESILPYFQRGVFAYRISEFFGFRIVPQAEIVKHEDRIGIAKKFIDGLPANELDEQPIAQLQKLALFDIVCNNYDRWHSNFLVDRRAKVWAIDNGDILCSYPAMSPMIFYLFTSWDIKTKNLAKEIVKRKKEYLSFVKKEYLDVHVKDSTTAKQIYNAIESNMAMLGLWAELYGR